MKTRNPKTNADVTELTEKAADFHGHLGPFLAIGVRMGDAAERILNTNAMKNKKLEATVKIPLLTPFSCVLDGIQVTTHCTVGNQKLRIENSQKEIVAYFKLQNSNRTLKVSVNPKIVEKLMSEISKGSSNEELAQKIGSMRENRLFTIGKQ